MTLGLYFKSHTRSRAYKFPNLDNLNQTEVTVSMGNSWVNYITAPQSLPLLPPFLQAAWGTLHI